jgi:glycosyl transferase, family 25
MNFRSVCKKLGAVVRKGPATARNIAFSRLDYWPVRHLSNDAVRNIPIYCVSLESAVRRRGMVSQQIQRMGMTRLVFVDAVKLTEADRTSLGQQGFYDEAAAQHYHQRPLTISEISCSLSHGRAYDLIVEAGDPIAMVIEDDCLFMPSQLDRIDLQALPHGWDLAFLNSFMENGRPRRRIAGNLFHGDAYTGSSAAYLVSAQGARTLAAGYKPVVHAADGYAGRNDVNRFMYYPDCALNGSVCYYYNSSIDYVRNVVKQPEA